MNLRHFALGLIAAAFLGAPGGALAQATLDRVSPLRAAEPTEAERPSAPQLTIERDVAQVDASGPQVMVGAIVLEGLTVLKPERFSDIIADYIGRSLGPKELAALTNRISERARQAGLVFATARIAPQKLASGVLIVEVDEGRIDRIEVEGDANTAARAVLAPLADGHPLTLDRLERRLLLAGDIDGLRVTGTRYLRSAGGGVLVVTLDQDSTSGRIVLTNEGTRPLGREQVRIEAMASQLLFSDDSLSGAYTISSLQPRELQYGRLRYEKRLNTGGTELSLSTSASLVRPGAYLSSANLRGRSTVHSLGLLQPLVRRRHSSLWLSGALELNNLTQRQAGVLVRHDRETVLRLGLYGYDDVLGGRLRVNTVLSQGLDLFDATGRGDPLASRGDAGGVFTAVNAWAEWTRPLGKRFSLKLAGDSQLASRPLLVGEEAALGGGAFLRGYDWSERSGDQGAMGSAELRYDLKRPLGIRGSAQAYAFADAGTVRNLSGGTGGGTLASAGGGFRLNLSRQLSASAEVAVPLTGPRYDTGNRRPRFNFGISLSF